MLQQKPIWLCRTAIFLGTIRTLEMPCRGTYSSRSVAVMVWRGCSPTSDRLPDHFPPQRLSHTERLVDKVAKRPLLNLAIGSWMAMSLPACGSPVAPIPPGDGIIIYHHVYFEGQAEALNGDVKNLEYLDGPCLRTTGDGDREPSWGDCISSVRVNPGWKATLYQHDSFKGQSFTITEDVPSLVNVPGPCKSTFNDCVSSIRISRVQ